MDSASDGEASSFYLPIGPEEFESTTATTSPWDASQQHGGPPSALLARTIERVGPRPDLDVARFSIDFFGGLPQGRVRTSATVVRAGKRIELVEATMTADSRTVAVARAWRVKPSAEVTENIGRAPVPVATMPAEHEQHYFASVDARWGYGRAIEWRFERGGFTEPGPTVVWARSRIPLVAGEEPSGLQRMLIIADSANGLSAVLDPREWLFIPPGLTLTTHRVDAGDWLVLDATTTIDPSGVGMAHATIGDARGQLGLVTQPLLLQPR